MSPAPQDLEEQVKKVIRDYVMQKGHMLAMKSIHEEFMDEEADFASWDQAVEIYTSLEWDREKLSDFLSICKRVVEGSMGTFSDTYFRLINVDDPEDLIEDFDQRMYSPDAVGESREGFQYEQKGNSIEAEYIYVDINTELTHGGELQDLVTEGSIRFTVDFEKNILILHSTSVIQVQKIKSIINRHTSAGLVVYYRPNQGTESGINRFNELLTRLEEGGVDVRETTSIRLTEPTEDGASTISELEYHGKFESEDSIISHPSIGEKINEGWYINRVDIDILYDDEVMSVTVAGSDIMSYTKVNNYARVKNGKEVRDILREIFIDVFDRSGK